MKWIELDNIHELPDGMAIIKCEKQILFGEFAENGFWVYPNTDDRSDESWEYEFSSAKKYYYFPIQVH